MQMVTISIPKMYYEPLSRWASVSRTLDLAQALLEQYSMLDSIADNDRDTLNIIIDELRDLNQPLNACNAACKEKRLQIETANLRAGIGAIL